jgi:hypothetical protein
VSNKKFAVQFLTWMFLVSAVFSFIGLGKANPVGYGEGWMWVNEGEVQAPEGVKPPKILFSSPKNNTVYTTSNISLIFNTTVPEHYMSPSIDYKASWQQNKTRVDQVLQTYNFSLTDVPEGSHYLEITATWKYVLESYIDTKQPWITRYTMCKVTGSEIVYFTVDTHSNNSQQSTLNNPKPFPTTIVVASMATVVLIGLSVLVYFRRRKH